jgi:UDP-3-O-[3-hydroxymyristoyl] glucosamine N-acyltransferase
VNAPIFSLQELAQHINAKVHGDFNCPIAGVMTLTRANSGQISFLDNLNYLKYLKNTQASAVILKQSYLDQCPTNALIVDEPYYSFARIAKLFEKTKPFIPGVHPTAIVGPGCIIDPNASIGAYAVLETNVQIKAGVTVGAHCVLNDNVRVAQDSCLYPGVTLYSGTVIGKRVIIHSGTVIGSDGFGFANHQDTWHKIPQLGGVQIGDDVEIGANVTIDRGSLEDTIIGDGVKIDNQIQIAHNVQVGSGTIIAGCTGIAGSTRIGKHCRIGGGSRINGHLEITDHVTLIGTSVVSNSITKPGIYASTLTVQPYQQWRRNIVRFKQLETLAKQVQRLIRQETEKK